MIESLSKTKAEDYLRDFASRYDGSWLGMLVEEVVSRRALPDQKTQDYIYESFCSENGLSAVSRKKKGSQLSVLAALTDASLEKAKAAEILQLETLVHRQGVNALSEGEKLSFHPNLTVVFGKNGSGKSGFVRILKRLSGSRTQEDIWQNIHKTKSKNQYKIEIVFKIGNVQHKLESLGGRETASLNQLSVFDGKCIPIYLTKSLDFSYEPYGFELFSLVSDSLKMLQTRLAADVRLRAAQKPLFEDLFDRNTSIGRFVSSLGLATRKEDLDKLPKWNKASERVLVAREKEKRDLNNLDQRAENLENRQQKLSALEEQLEEIQEEFSTKNIRLYLKLMRDYLRLKGKLTTKKGKTLEDYEIPQMESDEWQEFIRAGEGYIESLHGEHYPEENEQCVYCRQKLSRTAVKLIKLYRELFKEAETSDFDKAGNKLEETISKLERTSYVEAFPYREGDFKKILSTKQTQSSFAALEAADAKIKEIVNCLIEKNVVKIKRLNLHGLIGSVQKKSEKLEDELNEIAELRGDVETRMAAIEKSITELKDTKKFSRERGRVEKYIADEDWTRKTDVAASKLNTKPITDLGSKAWKEIVSDSFRKSFEKEVADLNAPRVNVDFHGEYGLQLREKNLEGIDRIDDFLSEGEQKAVALADFFAELSIQDTKAPAVFDDPATSFDHERKEKIAKRIVEESQSRQVIVFTHDLMFASNMYDLVLDQSKLDSNKAAFHDLNAEGGRVGVITENYYQGSVKLDRYLPKIEGKISSIDALKGEKRSDMIATAYGMLRRSVEKVVEERIFGSIITRWSDRIQLLSEPNATLDREKLKKARELHGVFSRYIEAHNQSDEMKQHAIPNLDTLKDDFDKVKTLAAR